MAKAAAIFGSQISEQRAGARRFQNHLVGAPSHIGEPRQHENVRAIAQLRRSRPIIGNLRFDDDLIRAASRAPEAIFQQTVPRQSPDQECQFPCRCLARRQHNARERQTRAQVPAARSAARRAELSQADRIAIEAGDDFSARPRFEGDVAAEAGRKALPALPVAHSLFRERASRG